MLRRAVGENPPCADSAVRTEISRLGRFRLSGRDRARRQQQDQRRAQQQSPDVSSWLFHRLSSYGFRCFFPARPALSAGPPRAAVVFRSSFSFEKCFPHYMCPENRKFRTPFRKIPKFNNPVILTERSGGRFCSAVRSPPAAGAGFPDRSSSPGVHFGSRFSRSRCGVPARRR